MEVEDFLRGSKWEILLELSNTPFSASTLSQRLNKSIANIVQILHILEAGGFVKKIATQKGKAGKPQTIYTLNKEICLITTLSLQGGKKVHFTPNNYEQYLLNVLALRQPAAEYALLKLFFSQEEFFEKIDGLAFLRSSGSDIEILTLTKEVEELRKSFSNMRVEQKGKKKKIISWAHTIDEIKAGVEGKEEYFLNLIKQFTIIYEREKGGFEKLREIQKNA